MLPEDLYQRWLKQRRVSPPDEFADRVMATIAEQNANSQRHAALAKLMLTIGASRLGRCAVCVGALLIGITPFVYLASVAKLIVF